MIAHQKLRILKLTQQLYGQRSVRLLDQMEMALEVFESSATEDEIAAENTVADAADVTGFTRRRPARRPFPEHLPRERVVEPGPAACLCCGGSRLRKLGEDVTETLEIVPRRWKVIQHVRENFTCRDCEKISQAPAPFHVIARGWAGPSLLAMILTATTPSCRSRPAVRPTPRDAGSTCATTGRSAGGIRRLRCSSTRATAAASIRRRIWPATPGCSRPTPPRIREAVRARPSARTDRGSGMLGVAAQGSACAARGMAAEGHARRPFFELADLGENARRSAQGNVSGVISPLNDVDPQAWLADVLSRIAERPNGGPAQACTPVHGLLASYRRDPQNAS